MHKEIDDYPGPRLTRKQMQTFLEYGWGHVGRAVFETWQEFNARFFGDRLRPLAIVLTDTSPYGHWIGCTHSLRGQRRAVLICLTDPLNAKLVSDRGVLLHEMVHAHLVERGENSAHEGAPWCREITRLSTALGRPDVVAEPQKVQRVNGKVARVTPDGVILRAAAAGWPHSVGIDLGSLLPATVCNEVAP